MLKSQDILVLLKLAGRPPSWTFDSIAHELGLSQSSVHRSLQRATEAGLYNWHKRAVNSDALLEFLVHGLRYVFPAVRQGEARGLPTAWAAPPMAKKLLSSRKNVPVWPDPMGKVRGIALSPLHQSVPDAARRDPVLGELLVLVDSIRIGDARERQLAAQELKERLYA